MSKVCPKYPVSAIPPVESTKEFTNSEKQEYGILTSTGIPNAYRVAFALGQGASRKDRTFDKARGIHACCGSRVAWRHKSNCKLLKFDDGEPE